MYHEFNRDDGFKLSLSGDGKIAALTRENSAAMLIDSEKDVMMAAPLSKEEWEACSGKITGWISYTIGNGNYDPEHPLAGTFEICYSRIVVTVPKS